MTGLDFQAIKAYYNRCVVNESLPPDDERNVDVDNFADHPRGVNWSDRLARTIERSDRPTCLLFSGLPGSGKSTELRRLMKRLERADRAHLLPIYIDAEDVIDLANTIDVPDIILNIVHATDRALLELEGGAPDNAMQSGYLSRFWHWLTTTDVSLTQIGAKVGLGVAGVPVKPEANVVLNMKSTPSFRQRVRVAVGNQLNAFLKQAHDELEGMEERVKALGYNGIIIIFDSLEKLRGISTMWRDVLLSAESLFRSGAPHLQLPVHVIYTVPPALAFRLNLEVEFMPMIKLRDLEGRDCEPGIAASRELIRRRVPDEDLHALLGESAEALILQLIRGSGGYPRELVRFLRRLFRDAEPQEVMSEHAFHRIAQEIQDEYRQSVPASAWPWLARVAHERFLTIESEEHREAADLMLSNNAVLRYRNDDMWFDLHPALYEIPGVQDAIRRYKPEGS